ncbi:carbohydrate ABC transporter permease [Brachybacterium alimentarium]|uniref:ABC transmembrane type-1 domain-containing protein n=1 Tax=Brachybacterium alimentarium TaxID=47845 RepID=A0A2A3YE99_9MICO|nr:sugar ABC transporter permease [Brachybacterium alimentarium]PCC37607.1 hypothetical protein CIK66_18460 [Brachybacterium alimentarium]
MSANTRTGATLSARSSEALSAWILIVPLAVLYAVFFAAPIALATVESFTTTTQSGLGLGATTRRFAGVDNYVSALSDAGIRDGFGRVFLIGIIQVPVMLVLATFFALLFDAGIVWGKKFFQAAIFLPHAIPGVIAALLWGALYLPQVSPIVRALRSLGIPADFLHEDVVLFSIMNMTTWEWTGYNMIIIFAALQAIPKEILESARMDGASGTKVALRIKLPLIIPALVVTLLFSVIGSLQQFAGPAVLRGITNNVDSRFTPNLAVYNLAMNEGQPGTAAALALIVALLAFVMAGLVLQIRERA